MIELVDRTAEAAWKVSNLEDYDQRLERAARHIDELGKERDTAALVIYETVLTASGRPLNEVRDKVRGFRETFEDEEDPLTIPRVSGIMNVDGEDWFFGDDNLRVMAGRLLGQFQHRVAQYNYVSEREVLKRWANSYDTRLFIRRRIFETEPVVGVVDDFSLPLMQYLRVAGGGDTLVPGDLAAHALSALGFDEAGDYYDLLAMGENLALRLDLPAPILGEMLEDIAREGRTEFPEPPRDEVPVEDSDQENPSGPGEPAPSGQDQTAREGVREDPKKGDEPTRVQDPQAADAPGVTEEGDAERPASPESGGGDAPGNTSHD